MGKSKLGKKGVYDYNIRENIFYTTAPIGVSGALFVPKRFPSSFTLRPVKGSAIVRPPCTPPLIFEAWLATGYKNFQKPHTRVSYNAAMRWSFSCPEECYLRCSPWFSQKFGWSWIFSDQKKQSFLWDEKAVFLLRGGVYLIGDKTSSPSLLLSLPLAPSRPSRSLRPSVGVS